MCSWSITLQQTVTFLFATRHHHYLQLHVRVTLYKVRRETNYLYFLLSWALSAWIPKPSRSSSMSFFCNSPSHATSLGPAVSILSTFLTVSHLFSLCPNHFKLRNFSTTPHYLLVTSNQLCARARTHTHTHTFSLSFDWNIKYTRAFIDNNWSLHLWASLHVK